MKSVLAAWDQRPGGRVGRGILTFCCGVCSSRRTASAPSGHQLLRFTVRFADEAIKAQLRFPCSGSGRRITFCPVAISGIFTRPCQSLSEVVSGSQGVHDVHVQ